MTRYSSTSAASMGALLFVMRIMRRRGVRPQAFGFVLPRPGRRDSFPISVAERGGAPDAHRGPIAVDGPSSAWTSVGQLVSGSAGVVAAVAVLAAPLVAPRRLHGEVVAIGQRPVGQVPPGALVGVLG